MQAVPRWGILHQVFMRIHVTKEGTEDGRRFQAQEVHRSSCQEFCNEQPIPPGLRGGLKILVRHRYRDVKPRVRGAQPCEYQHNKIHCGRVLILRLLDFRGGGAGVSRPVPTEGPPRRLSPCRELPGQEQGDGGGKKVGSRGRGLAGGQRKRPAKVGPSA